MSVADEDVGDPSRAGCACRGRASSPGRGTLEGCRGRICLRVTGLRLQSFAGWRMTGGAGGGLGREAAVPSGAPRRLLSVVFRKGNIVSVITHSGFPIPFTSLPLSQVLSYDSSHKFR